MKTITFLLLCCVSISYSQSEQTDVTPFIKDIVAQFPNARDIALSENEAVFSAQSVMGDVSALVTIKKSKKHWSEPEVLSFSGQYFDIEPYFASDGLTLYFASNRPLNEASSESKDFDIWFVHRADIHSKWSEPQNLGAPINTKMDEFYPVVTDSKNIYFTLDNKSLKRKDDIYVSEFKNGKYSSPKPLSDAINTDGYEFNAFIAPDESFLVYTCYNRKDGYGSGDLYISYRDKNTKIWSKSKNMGELINSNKMDYCPFVDISTNTLYFTSKRITTTNNHNSKMNIQDLKNVFNSYENGASRIYKAPMPIKN
ncbi:hypothetical protein [Psychroserpens sp.]|uniref:hypothetical protein n=1 Tax=Psychroserpens sp. TaxID=2020870 RepID=UPI00385E90B2